MKNAVSVFMHVRRFLSRFMDKFFADDTFTLAASLAFYAALSLAPFLILFVSITGLMHEDLQRDLVVQVSSFAGPDAAEAVDLVIHSAQKQTELSSVAGIVAVITLLLSASLIFGQLRVTLNRIFSVSVPHIDGETWLHEIWTFVRTRLMDIALAMGGLLVAIGSVVISTYIVAEFRGVGGGVFIALGNALISAAIYVGLFTLLFRYLPTTSVRWARAFQGGAITAILFVIGKELIAYYLGRRALASAYGAAGSIVALLVWVYYSALIIFVGAQVGSILTPSRRDEKNWTALPVSNPGR